jgi:hypothetical protein
MMGESKKWRHGPNAEEIAAIFETLSNQIPGMIRGILDSLFSPEAAARMGKAVAEFNKHLKEGGIPEDEALEMTKDYLSTLTKWSDVMRGARFGPTTERRYWKKEKEE